MTCYRCHRPANTDSGLCCGCEDRKRDAEEALANHDEHLLDPETSADGD